MTTAADVMTWPVVSVARDTPARVALVLLLEHRFAALPVVHEHRVVGTLTEDDLLHAGMRRRNGGATAGEVMTPAVTMPASATVSELAAAMLVTGLRSLAIVDDRGHLTGIVSRVDLLRSLMDEGGRRRIQ